MKPESFDTVVYYAKALSGYNDDSESHDSYSSALRVGFSVMDLVMVVKCTNVRNQQRDKAAIRDNLII